MEKWASILTALATIVLAAVAIYGYDMRRMIRRPRLRIKVDDPRGNGTYFVNPEGERQSGCRWFHVNVWPSIREFPFHHTFVELREVKEERPDGEFHSAWRGRVPLQWRHEPPFRQLSETVILQRPFERKTVGPLAQADLFHIDENAGLRLSPIEYPNDLARAMARICRPKSRSRLALVVQAVSDEGDSDPHQIVINWSGEWAEADSDFERLIVVREHATQLT